MKSVRNGLSGIVFKAPEMVTEDYLPSPIAYAYFYMQWDANETISNDLIRNLGLTFATIAIVTFALIINIQICAMVLICVVLTVTNVCGYAFFLGLTIEVVTSMTLILTVGLALDYAAHFAVRFACLKVGTRQEKMSKSLE